MAVRGEDKNSRLAVIFVLLCYTDDEVIVRSLFGRAVRVSNSAAKFDTLQLTDSYLTLSKTDTRNQTERYAMHKTAFLIHLFYSPKLSLLLHNIYQLSRQ